MQDFQEFINNLEMQDLPMIGRCYTWSNFQAQCIQSRLDRFLLAQEWLDKFSISLWGLKRVISDHCPILITNETKNWGPKPFRFMNVWLHNPQVMKIVKEEWRETNNQKWAGTTIMNKLRLVRQKLKEWNSMVFGDLNTKSEALKNNLHQLDLISESRELTAAEREERERTRADYWACDRLRESIWRQKSRVKWVKQGDRNTRFFQAYANGRFRRNFIGVVEIDGILIDDPIQIKEAAGADHV